MFATEPPTVSDVSANSFLIATQTRIALVGVLAALITASALTLGRSQERTPEAAMSDPKTWQQKTEFVPSNFGGYKRNVIENDHGVRLLWRGFDHDALRLEENPEIFDYIDGNIKLLVLASRFDKTTQRMSDRYNVELGLALQIASRQSPAGAMSAAQAHRVAQNIKDALLIWRLPGKIAEIAGATSPATSVKFNIEHWDKLDPAARGDWP